MRRLFRIVFSRYGIVAIILVVVIIALALAQTRDDTPLSGSTSGNGESSDESEIPDQMTADDGIATFDCEGEDCYAAEELPEEAVDRALAFAEAWLNPDGLDQAAWYESIAPYLTEDRAAAMEQVDPTSVPAQSIEGEATAEGNRVSIPTDTGTLILSMSESANGWTSKDWLVSAIDWESP
ncbi:hypothetical protein [Glycomyces salinus]|uniref:hypothetical protein n=1 Tax=Glycomyces salinus TaxID=980294 RepID=UPI0018EB62D9|nr:hypothetical protein [Glycomyces salinus]